MKNINEYKRRFYNLLESTMGDVKPLIMEEETKPMSWLGNNNPREIKKENYHGYGFFDIAYDSNGIIGGVENFYVENGVKKSSQSQKVGFNMSEQMGIPGNGGSLESAISFNYETIVKAGNTLNLSFKAGNLSSQSFTLNASNQDTYYKGRFTIINLPQNSTITITANGDNENKLVVKTKSATQQQGQTQSQPTTSNGTIAKLESGKSTYLYYYLDNVKKTLVSRPNSYANGKLIEVNTTVTIDTWSFKDNDTTQQVYVKEINGNKVTLSNTAGSAVVTINK